MSPLATARTQHLFAHRRAGEGKLRRCLSQGWPMSSQSRPRAFAEALARLHAAMAKVANGDVSAIKSLYAHSEDATSFYGWGGYEKGWDAVSRRWDWAGRQFKGGTVSYQTVTVVETAELGYTTEIETFKVGMEGLDRPAQ